MFEYNTPSTTEAIQPSCPMNTCQHRTSWSPMLATWHSNAGFSCDVSAHVAPPSTDAYTKHDVLGKKRSYPVIKIRPCGFAADGTIMPCPENTSEGSESSTVHRSHLTSSLFTSSFRLLHVSFFFVYAFFFLAHAFILPTYKQLHRERKYYQASPVAHSWFTHRTRDAIR